VAGVQGAQAALLGPLKEVLESVTGGYEVMKEVVAALQDTERGKTASMTVLLQELQERQASKPSREEQERLRLEVIAHAVNHFASLACAVAALACVKGVLLAAVIVCGRIVGSYWLEQNSIQKHSRTKESVLVECAVLL